MNAFVLVVACISSIATVAHIFGGIKETAAIAPLPGNKKLKTHWMQAMCAFQMLSVDLIIVSVALFVVAFADLEPHEGKYVLTLSFLFFLWGTVWVVQLIWLKARPSTHFRLPQGLLWFLCSGLLYIGA